MKMKKSKENIRRWFLYLSSFLVVCIVTIIIVLLILNKNNTPIILSNSNVIESLSNAYDSTVYIESTEENESNGSGFIYKIDNKYAYILTNEHVVNGKTVKVTNNKNKEVDGTVLGKDEYLDIAIVRIDKKYALNKVNFAKKYKVKIGEKIYAIGTPISKSYQNSVTSGIISGKDRIVKTIIHYEEKTAMKVLQFDAAINSGNSGGPLLNEQGEVIGLCTMKLDQANIEGMAFAIPLEDIEKNLPNLEKGKKIVKPDLGISVADSDDYSTLYKNDIVLSSKIDYGAVIINKEEDSIVKKLKVGDVIIKIDNEEITDSVIYKYALYKHKKGDKIKITFIRDDKEKTISIEV